MTLLLGGCLGIAKQACLGASAQQRRMSITKRQRQTMTEVSTSARPNANTIGKTPTGVFLQGHLGVVPWACLATAARAHTGQRVEIVKVKLSSWFMSNG